jgi:hypothetical protein
MVKSKNKIRWFQVFLFGVCLLLFIIVGNIEVVAQGMPGPPVFPGTPNEAPIDGGLGLLAAAGGAYALKKLKGRKNEEGLD